MKKYILKNGEEVEFGDIIEVSKKCKGGYLIIKATLDEDSLDMFKQLGIIREREIKDNNKNVMNDIDKMKDAAMLKHEELLNEIREFHINKVYESIARNLGVNKTEAIKYVQDLSELNTASAFSLVLKRMALILDRNYEGHIADVERTYYVSVVDGKIHTILTSSVNPRNVALFRNYNDAQFAIECFYWLYDKMFNTKQKDAKQESN